jgi:hypothetical protein
MLGGHRRLINKKRRDKLDRLEQEVETILTGSQKKLIHFLLLIKHYPCLLAGTRILSSYQL